MAAATDAVNPMGWQKLGGAESVGKAIVDADKVYDGTMVTFDDAAGLDEFEPAQDAAGHIFAGISTQTVDNADDGLKVNVNSTPGLLFYAEAGTGFTPNAGDVGQVAFVADDQTVQSEGNATHNVRVGRIVEQDGTRVVIRSEPWTYFGSSASAAEADITDSSGGTASDTIADIEATYTEATIANAFATVAAHINSILTVLKAEGLMKD